MSLLLFGGCIKNFPFQKYIYTSFVGIYFFTLWPPHFYSPSPFEDQTHPDFGLLELWAQKKRAHNTELDILVFFVDIEIIFYYFLQTNYLISFPIINARCPDRSSPLSLAVSFINQINYSPISLYLFPLMIFFFKGKFLFY